ncbi:MAG: DUF3253 domain-containing protein [Anaerolineae bacterium]
MARRISDNDLYNHILRMCGEAGPEKSVTPGAVAQSIAEFDWQSMLKRVKQTATHQAKAGYIYIMRKGKPADPDDFRGVYKLRLVEGVDWQAIIDDETINRGSGIQKRESDES